MKHFIRIASWIFTLFACHQVGSVPLHDSNIIFMRAHVKCPSDSIFYAPKNVEEQCITTALDCIQRELDGTVREECVDPQNDIGQAIDFFETMIYETRNEGHATSNSSECACERWPQIPFSQFLDQVERLLQFKKTQAMG